MTALKRSVYAAITGFRIKSNESVAHKRDGDLFQLHVPYSVVHPVSDDQVGGIIVMSVAVDMMNALIRGQWSSTFFGCDNDVLGNVSALVRVRVRWVSTIVVAISEWGSLFTGARVYSRKDAPTCPPGIERPGLITFGCNPSRNSHFMHCTPNDFLGDFVFLCDLILTHAKGYIVPVKLFFGERHGVGVLVAHTGIISYACTVS